ncbi:MAG: ORF6N domain-containing protein, partial [Campylobacterota bacterium]|nr:ORF6N domain-containing protein [Campylobacterota bacterium]
DTRVMLDRDLAKFYDVETRRLKEQVKRNIDRFPDDFMFQLTDEEVKFMVSQNAIPSKQHLGGSFPFAFTEQGEQVDRQILNVLGELIKSHNEEQILKPSKTDGKIGFVK